MVRHKIGPGSVLAQKSGHVDDDAQISALDVFYEMDGRKSRFFGEVLDWYRGEDAGDLKRSELNELVENLICLNALVGEIWKSNGKIVTDQNSVMNEELVQNSVMDETFVKNIVMNAKIDPKVVMDLSILKIGGWNSLQPSNQKLLEEFIDENERWLLIGISNSDIIFGTTHCVSSNQHMRKLMSLRDGLHVMQCYMRQHFADCHWLRERPGGHAL